MKYIILIALLSSVLLASVGCRHRHPRKIVIFVEQSVHTAVPLIA